MTIDEAIIKHIQIADSYHKAMPNYDEAADHRQLAEWLLELKDLRAEQNDQYIFIHELMMELKEAKRLLKLAVEDIHDVLSSQIKITNYTLCEKCKHYLNCNCKDKCVARYNLKQWRFADEALKLIGDESSGV